MLSPNRRSPADILDEARQTCRRGHAAVDELNDVREKAEETVEYLRWWRFLGYDPAVLEFLEHLDMGLASRQRTTRE